MALSKEEIIEAIKEMSVLDMADLVKALEDEFGVSAAPVAVAVAESVDLRGDPPGAVQAAHGVVGMVRS